MKFGIKLYVITWSVCELREKESRAVKSPTLYISTWEKKKLFSAFPAFLGL
jgi:hypothetical protein